MPGARSASSKSPESGNSGTRPTRPRPSRDANEYGRCTRISEIYPVVRPTAFLDMVQHAGGTGTAARDRGQVRDRQDGWVTSDMISSPYRVGLGVNIPRTSHRIQEGTAYRSPPHPPTPTKHTTFTTKTPIPAGFRPRSGAAAPKGERI